METFIIEASKRTPYVLLDPSGKIEISGSSTNSEILEFYQPILDWINEYMMSPSKKTSIKCKLMYYNTITCKILLHIFKTLEKLKDPNQVEVLWHYEHEDEDMREFGEDFKGVLKNMEFIFIEDKI